jgi:hypothetical protein
MNDVPDWLWQGIATNLLTDSVVAAAWLAWKYREAIAQKLSRQPVVKQASILIQSSSTVTVHPTKITVADRLGITDNVNTTIVEEPSHSLARRLEELASWYLHVS